MSFTHEALADGVDLYCGDCLEVLPTLARNSADCIITDPPYGIDYQSARRIDKATWKPKLQGDDATCLDWIPVSMAPLTRDGCCLSFCRWDVEEQFRDALRGAGMVVKSQVIWDRMNHGMGDLSAAFAPQHDNAVFATRGDFAFPGKRPYSIIRIARIPPESLVHPTEKLVPLLCYFVAHLSWKGQTILDPFGGAGSTIVAAVQLERKAIYIEIEPRYYDIAKRRILAALQQGKLL